MRPFELGCAGTDLRRRLVELVLAGEKTASAGLAEDHAPHTDGPLPIVAERFRLLERLP